MYLYLLGVSIAIIPTIHYIIYQYKSSWISLLDIILGIVILLCSWASVFIYVGYLIVCFIIYSTFVLLVICFVGWFISIITDNRKGKQFCIILAIVATLVLRVLFELHDIKSEKEQTEITNKK